MQYVGRRIYYDINTGDLILDTGEKFFGAVKTTLEEDISTYKVLSERNIESFDYIDLEYGYLANEFSTCTTYKVNVLTKEIEFFYSDGSNNVNNKPLSEQLKELEERQKATEDALLFIMMGGI